MMAEHSLATVVSAYALGEDLRSMTASSTKVHDLPGRYGRVIRDLQRVLTASGATAVVAGGWAVWRHGYAGRVTEDVDIVVAKAELGELQRVSSMCGFKVLKPAAGRWPKLLHCETGIEVDLLPEGGVPGTPSRPAPVPIRHPQAYDGRAGHLDYISLAGLFELKLGASRARDIADLIEVVNQNQSKLDAIREHLTAVHPSYTERLDSLIQQAKEES